MEIYLKEFDFESFENDFSYKGMIAEKLSLLKSMYYFTFYAVKAVTKNLKK